MKIKPLKIISVGSYVNTLGTDEELPDLKPLVKELSGKVIRRVTRFVQLSLIGALRCSAGHQVNSGTGVYLSSCRGDTAVTVDLLDELVRGKQPPSPMTFVNSVSNAACFHVAAALGLHGKSNFVTNRFDPWIAAAKLAQIDLHSNQMHTALVGSVDSVALPLKHHRQRLHISQSAPVAEASHWMLLADEQSNESAIAILEAIHHFANAPALYEWLKKINPGKNDRLGIGQHLTPDQVDSIVELANQSPVLLHSAHAEVSDLNNKTAVMEVGEKGYYDSATGESVIEFIHNCSEGRLIHINSDPGGRFTVMVVSR